MNNSQAYRDKPGASLEAELSIATQKISEMSETIIAQEKLLDALKLQLKQEQEEKLEIERDYCHIVGLVQQQSKMD